VRPNETRRKLAAGQPALGIFVSSASGLVAEIVGGLGFDWVLVDLQHGENNLGNLGGLLQAVSTTGATPFVRVPVNDPMQIGRALDLGAYGVIVPLVNSAAQAEAAVRAAKYPPRGGRSWGPIRGSLYGGPDYFEHADRETMLFAMIETVEAVANAREILSVDGIDGCLVGPNDLSITHGVGPEGGETLAPEVERSIENVVAACQTTGKIAGMQLYSAASANRRIGQGFRLVGLGTELRSMRAALSGLLGAVER
jgi:4-hydroxy-2-oxoheptanedioate aldolase